MAITRAQQARQMLKDGNFAVQGGVKNYLGEQETVSDVPIKWKSGPDKPSTELAYITKAEKDLLLKKDIHGSLKDGPNKGPGGLMSLDSFGDDPDDPGKGFSGADVSAAERGEKPSGMSQQQADEFRGGVIAAGAGARDSDTAGAKKEAEKIKRQVEKRKREARRAITKEEKKEARINRRRIQQRLNRDRLRRQERLKGIFSGAEQFSYVDPITGETITEDLNPGGLTETEKNELASVSNITGIGPKTELQQTILNNLLEKSDKFSGAEMEAFKEKFNLPDLPGALGLGLKLFEGPLKKGSRVNKDFFTDRVLNAGRFKYKGQTVTPEMFQYLSPTEMQEVYGNYMDQRQGGEIDAIGNPIMRQDDGGPDPILPIIPTTQDPTTPTTPDRNLGGLSARIGGSLFNFDEFAADGGRIGAAEGGIMDLARQEMFLGGIAKGLKKITKSATRAIKKIAKSPIGKAALLYAGGSFLGGLKTFGGAGFGQGNFLSNLKSGQGIGNLARFAKDKLLGTVAYDDVDGTRTGGILEFLKDNPYLAIGGASVLAGAMTPKKDDEFDLASYYASQQLTPSQSVRGVGSEMDFYNYNLPVTAADGGRIGYQEGSKEPVAKETMPLLDMGGKEMDLREDGGFVPIGRMEKADDVPARLSKNEFVFTADAVRNAGDGDVDKGAEVMYNMMKNLESGGDVSEESQGLEGAREMFQTSKRLEEVL